jgi:predicted outer membrane repeat protein
VDFRATTARVRFLISLAALTTTCFFIPGVPVAEGAENFFVECPGDSLQAAIDAASPGDAIYVHGTCVENVVIDKNLSIGDIGGRLDGGGSGPVVHVLPGVSAGISWIGIDNGFAEYGGGILNEGNLFLDMVSMSGNRATVAGGAIRNDGDLGIWDSYIDGNIAEAGGDNGGGGAIYNLGTADIGFAGFNDNAAPTGRGGAIFNLGEMVLWDVGIGGNRSAFGGAIANGYEGHDGAASLSLDEVYMSGNHAPMGGAIRLEGGGSLFGSSVFITGSRAVEGGGISADGTAIELTESEIRDNTAAIGGGGVALRDGATLTGDGLLVSGNTAAANGGGILCDDSEVDLTASQITMNAATDGAGIANTAGASSSLSNTQVTENTAAHFGGGVFNAGSDIWISQSSIAYNEADVRGGGVANIRGAENGRVFVTNSTLGRNVAPRGSAIDNLDVFVSLDHVTITDNRGGVAFYEDRSPPWTRPVNSIIAGNAAGDCSSALLSGGGNVVGDCVFVDENGDRAATRTDLLGANPYLIPGRYGAHALVYRPDSHSPAIDRVPVTDCSQLVDQVGVTRPMGLGCDSGSREIRVYPGTPVVDADFAFGHTFASSPIVLSGVATDDVDIVRVLVAIKDRSTGLWLQSDLETWGPHQVMDAALATPGEPSTAWSIHVDLPAGDYSLAARAFDQNATWFRIATSRWLLVCCRWRSMPTSCSGMSSHLVLWRWRVLRPMMLVCVRSSLGSRTALRVGGFRTTWLHGVRST